MENYKVKSYRSILSRIQKAEDKHLKDNLDLKEYVAWDNDNEDVDGTGRYYSCTGHLSDHSFTITIDRLTGNTDTTIKLK